MEKVYSYIDEHKDEFLEELFELVRIPSVSPLPGYADQVQKCAKHVSSIMEKCGIKSTIYQTEHNPVVYGETKQVEGRPTILIYGHYDVQPEGDRAEWESDPYEPEIRDGRIYARGVGDNKGQIFAHIKAYQAYCAAKGEPEVNLKYMVEGEEEIGSIDLGPFVAAHKDLLKADITIWSDSNIHASGKPLIILGLKGISSMKITVKGPESDVHSQWGSVLPNPVWKLINILSSLKDENGRVKIPGFYDQDTPGEAEKQAIANIPSDLTPFVNLWKSPDFDGSMDSVEFFTKFMYEPTINIGCISAGNVIGTKNIVPHEASCWIDMRLGPNQDSEQKRKDFCDYIASLGYTGVEIEGTGADAAFTPLNNPFVQPVIDIIQDLWGQEPIIYPGLGGSGPFTVFNNILGAPCIFVPFADAQQHDHAANENIPVDNLILGTKIGAAMIDRFAKVK
jgi:acetylornithine deacetylase/succinyl-diaminopimelate desuccinylase-like protein